MTRRKKIFSSFFVISLLSLVSLPISAQEISSKNIGAVGDASICSFKLLNKTTSRSEILTLEKGKFVTINTLDIILHDFIISKPSERPEIKAFIEIFELISEIDRESIFKGWIFKSAPAINPLQHPVYDIIITNCE